MSEEKSLLQNEIGQQPQAVAQTLQSCASEVEALGRDIRSRQPDFIMIAARGSSDNAGIYAKYLFQAFNGIPVTMTTPSLYTFYHRPPRLKNVLVLGISQSGQSEDIVEVLTDARRQGAMTAAITAESASPLAAQSDHTLMLKTGAEKAVAATKTFTASLAVLASLSAAIEQSRERKAQAQELPGLLERTLALVSGPAAARAERYRYMQRCVVISRGFCYSAAMEVALKLKELTYVTAESYSSADFLHGPMAMLEPGFPVILIAPSGTLLPHMCEFADQLRERKSEIIAISDADEILSRGITRFPLAQGAQEWLSPVLAVIPGQLLGLHLSIAKGLDPDSPRGLNKVTVTR
ncbi:MAG: SIS domain-containing protein [Spirochaetia bacterium]|jgi:glucosamine--fructose-6-phosphate aminotransferase (isomerizing)